MLRRDRVFQHRPFSHFFRYRAGLSSPDQKRTSFSTTPGVAFQFRTIGNRSFMPGSRHLVLVGAVGLLTICVNNIFIVSNAEFGGCLVGSVLAFAFFFASYRFSRAHSRRAVELKKLVEFALNGAGLPASTPSTSVMEQWRSRRSTAIQASVELERSRGYSNWASFPRLRRSCSGELHAWAGAYSSGISPGTNLLPLPEDTPVEVDDWSEPRGTLHVPGTSQISQWSSSVIVMAMGLLAIAGGIGGLFMPGRHPSS